MANEIADELRVIGADAHGMLPADRAMLAHAADEIDTLSQLLIATQAELIESQVRRIALNERMLEIEQKRLSLEMARYGIRVTWNLGDDNRYQR